MKWSALIVWVLWMAAVPGWAASFTAALDQSTTFVGEPVTLQLKFEGGNPREAPQIPAPDGLSIQFEGQSFNTSFDNGRMSSVAVLQYLVTPFREGDFTIPGLTARIGAQTFTTQPLALKVVKQGAETAKDDPIRKLAFIRVVTFKDSYYVGETFPFEIHFYFQTAREVSMPQLKGDGFTFGKIPRPTQNRAQVGRDIYNRYVFRTSATAVREGTLNLGPFEIPATLVIPRPNRRQADEFGGDFFSQFLGQRAETRSVKVVSDEHKIKVLPLPENGRPADFSGAVGQYGMQVTANPTSLGVGDPITLKVQISGKGSIESLSMPGTGGAGWSDFKTYPSTSKVESSDELGVEGTKTFEQVVIPESTSARQIPGISFSFFDPQAKAYRSLAHPPTPLQLTAGNVTSAQPTVLASPAAAAGSEEKPQKDIVHIKPHPGTLAALSAPWVERPWFWLLQTLPLVFWIGVVVWKNQSDRIANNPRLRRRMEVGRRESEGLGRLRILAEKTDSNAFFAEAFRLLQDRLGEKLDLPAASITESVIEERLRKMAAPDALCELLLLILQACDQARFSPVASASELKSWLKKIESGLSQLRDWNPPSA